MPTVSFPARVTPLIKEVCNFSNKGPMGLKPKGLQLPTIQRGLCLSSVNLPKCALRTILMISSITQGPIL